MERPSSSAFSASNESFLTEDRLRSLLENLPDLVLVVDPYILFHYANRGVAGVDREAMVGQHAYQFSMPEYRETCDQAFARAFASHAPQACRAQDIFGHWWSIRIIPLTSEAGAERALVISTDVTSEHLALESLKKEQRLLRRLLDLHERDRQMTAYDIHDGFAQQIAGALFQLQGFRETVQDNPQGAWAMFDSALALLARSVEETRRLISGLSPPILDELGIVEAIRYLVCEQREHGGPEIDFEHEMPSARLPPPLEIAVFRVVQESLNNACRHSRSDRIRITLIQRDGRIHVEVRDWGVGFNPAAAAESHFGLQGIRERARLLGGTATIESAPGKGTQISVEFPEVAIVSDAEPFAG